MPSVSAVACELTLLHTVAHVGFATTDQLHTTCFLDEASSTVRLHLAAQRSAGCLALTPWRLPRVCQERGSVWTLTPTGRTTLYTYGVSVEAPATSTLAVPSTALERDEWRVRMAVRSLIVRLIVQARRSPTLADLRVQVRTDWPTPYAPPRLHGDAQLDLVWTPATVHPRDWLPWTTGAPLHGAATRYLVYIDRPLAVDALLHRALPCARHADATVVILWQTAERLAQALHYLPVIGTLDCPIRMTTHDLLDRDLVDANWRDAHGRPCSLRPRTEELRAYHAPVSA